VAKTEKVLEGVSSVEVNHEGTTFVFDVQNLIIEADDHEPNSRDDYESWLMWEHRRTYDSKFIHTDPTTYAIKGSMKPDSEGVWFKIMVKQNPVSRTASLEVANGSLPELERARKRCGAPSDAVWGYADGYVTFTWEEE
jgi:hypothetical protein